MNTFKLEFVQEYRNRQKKTLFSDQKFENNVQSGQPHTTVDSYCQFMEFVVPSSVPENLKLFSIEM